MRRLGLGAAIGAAVIAAGCAPRVRLAPDALAPDHTVVLNGHPLRLHFANPRAPAGLPLLVFATGDGGWHRKDLDVWRHLASWGYPIVGFDARDYVTHLTPPRKKGDSRHSSQKKGTAAIFREERGLSPFFPEPAQPSTTPARLAADYARIIEAARAALNLGPERAVVLVGVSRGAGLSVVAAGQRLVRGEISGVLAVALTREEEYVKWYRRLRRRDPPARQPEMVQVYDYLPRLGDLPIAVVQSTRDSYLPAAAARTLFGPDTPHRRFQAIDARNHSFAGARDDLYRAMAGSLDWIDSQISAR